MDLVDRVRTSCTLVARRARHVRTVAERIEPYAAELAGAPPPTLDDPAHRSRPDAESTAAHVLAIGAANFGSAWFRALRPVDGRRGYDLVAAALDGVDPLTASWLVAVTPSEVAARLGQEGNVAVEPFLAAVAAALSELGCVLIERYDGSAAALVEAAGGSVVRLAGELGALPGWRDAARYDGAAVWFAKRAQLCAADLARALAGHAHGRFDDLARLTVFADDLVPHVLRTDGVLVYDDELARTVDAGIELAAGSRAEVEVRAATVVAGDLLAAALDIPAAELDWRLWARGQSARYAEGPTRRHRCFTSAY